MRADGFVVALPEGFEMRPDGLFYGGAWVAGPFRLAPVTATLFQVDRTAAASLRHGDVASAPGYADGSRFIVETDAPGAWTATTVVERAAAWRGCRVQAALARVGVACGTADWQVEAVRRAFALAEIVSAPAQV